MKFESTEFPGLYVIEPKVFGDRRGYFLESYSARAFAEAGIEAEFIQDNHAFSREKGVLRGLHFQVPPAAQAKLVRVVSGAVLDVVVDLRKGSPAHGRHMAVELTGENFRQVYIPRGFAHAYLTLTENVHFQYKVDAPYAPALDAGLAWNDPDLAIDWPAAGPVLSDKDARLGSWADFESPFEFVE